MATKFDLLVAAKATEKEFSKRVKRLEDECKAEFVEEYRTNGSDRKRSTVFDSKAAWMTMKGGKPSEHVTRFQLNDYQEAVDWMDETRPETDSFAQDNLERFCEWWFFHTGECPDGCTVIEYESEPVEPTPALTVKETAVLDELKKEKNAALSGAVTKFLLEDKDVEWKSVQLLLGDCDA